ncbi:putative reverse transcriptase domain-containing protein [Tanacetum coccineum]
MNRMCKLYLEKFVNVFIDDILIYSKYKEEHELQEVHFLRHVVNSNGIYVDPSKIEAVRKWKVPKTLSEIRSFLGLAAFQTLKDNLCNASILSLPHGPKDFVVYCDTLNQGFGYVLMQRGKVIAYASRQLKSHEKNYTIHDLELGGVVFALKTWRHYLYGTKSIIYTNHKSLQHIFYQKELNMHQQRWIKLFSDYDCEIRYHPGQDNVVVDALNKILVAQDEASKVENVTTEMLRSLDQQMEKKEDGAIRGDYKMIEKLARLYIDKIVARHGVPVLIISDRDGMMQSPYGKLSKTGLEATRNQRRCRRPFSTRIEQDDLTNFIPPTPHDSPLSGGHTPGSDEGRPNINELMVIYTNLSNRVLALEQSKTVLKKINAAWI